MATCKNCKSEISEKYCPNCGEPLNLKRIDCHYIVHEIEHVLHFEKGIFYTIRELLLKPGDTIRHFIVENRNRLVKPILFIIITSLIYTFAIHYFDIEDRYVKIEGLDNSTIDYILKWNQKHYGYFNIILGAFIALWLKIFFKKYPYNYFEILILLCFVLGMNMLLLGLFVVFQGLTHIEVMKVAAISSILYSVWAIGQFFDRPKVMSYVKALAAYLLGFMTYMAAVLLIGSLIDLITKH